MSYSGNPMSEMGLDGLNDRLRNSLSCSEGNNGTDINKPDFLELDLGSPVSTLLNRPNGLSTSTSSSSSSSGSMSGQNGSYPNPKRFNTNHSGEVYGSVESSPTTRRFKPGHTRSRSDSYPLIYSGRSSVNSSALNSLPTGNICPSGKILKTAIPSKSSKTDVLGSRTGNYGHGSIIRGGGVGGIDGGAANAVKDKTYSQNRGMLSNDPEELKRTGNENYRKGNFTEALNFYDKAIVISPGNAAYHCNRAAALMGLKRVAEAVKECEEAIMLDPSYYRAHQRLGSLLLSLGQVENARNHMCILGHQPDQGDLLKLQAVEKHIGKCTDARKVADWWSTLREADAAIASGADASPQSGSSFKATPIRGC